MEAMDCQTVKEAILYCLEVSPVYYGQHFHTKKSKENEQAHLLAQLLRNMGPKWLKPAKKWAVELFEFIVLEQIIWDLEDQTQK